MSNALDKDTRYALRLCWDFLSKHKDVFMYEFGNLMTRDFLTVRKEVGHVLHRHAKKETHKQGVSDE